MLPSLLIVAASLLSAVSAAPQPTQANVEATWTSTSTLSATVTFNVTTTLVTTLEPTTTTSTTSSSKPTYTATEIYAYKPDSPIHLLPFQAIGEIFRLGGVPGTYCPSFIADQGGCQYEANITGVTGMNGCALSTIVPGGQGVYMAPDGQIRFTQAHSGRLVPSNSQICPFVFKTFVDSDATQVTVSGFNATTFAACPMLNNMRGDVEQVWQVYGKTTYLSPPADGRNSSSCIDFEAVGIKKQLGHNAATWQYI